eukprot:CAMPEP_0204160912 /NCGR_PEP_ID=MMETSP0361-20130328/34273_1 /ASSEMBLY_ACC=CAM_ASM_000343 /TAXON_ID=268821 /ORGANISM="Scrippsiella Hangoei, Strain SHTV-5" /LENGTH=171 /DNA_ID=CAMNT_0051117255 /DNA_START=144 /DNA_END=654 /DNA_ORIENTATION=-
MIDHALHELGPQGHVFTNRRRELDRGWVKGVRILLNEPHCLHHELTIPLALVLPGLRGPRVRHVAELAQHPVRAAAQRPNLRARHAISALVGDGPDGRQGALPVAAGSNSSLPPTTSTKAGVAASQPGAQAARAPKGLGRHGETPMRRMRRPLAESAYRRRNRRGGRLSSR